MIKINLFLSIIISFLCSLTIDLTLGELPEEIHPVVIIGILSNKIKNIIKNANTISGLIVLICLTLTVFVLLNIIYFVTQINDIIFFIFYCVLLSSTFSVKLLLKSAGDVKKDLDESIDRARQSVSYLVSRNTDELTESFIVSATVESLTENITDSYIAVLFYYTLCAAVVLVFDFKNPLLYLLMASMFYRISNTLDAMYGYKTDELIKFGFFPAKLDDILNYIPSRISGFFVVLSAYVLGYNGRNAFNVMMRDARNCPSPNSGYTMAPTAGALEIQLVKKDTYVLGDSIKEITKDDIKRAVRLSALTIFLSTVVILSILTLFWVML